MNTEPALIVGFISAALVLAVAFGVPISDDQTKAVIAFVTAAIPIVGAFITRSQVTPTKKAQTVD